MALFSRKSTPGTPTGPTIPGNAGELLSEIASSTQQRRYTAQLGETEIVLDAANRELLCIISVSPATFPHADAPTIVTRDDDHLAGQLTKLGGLFAAFGRLDGRMKLTSVAPPLRYSSKLQGFSIEELSAATDRALKSGEGVQSDAREPPPRASAVPAPAAVVEPPAVTAPVRADYSEFASGDTRFFSQVAASATEALVVTWSNEVLASLGSGEIFGGIRSQLLSEFGRWNLQIDAVTSGRKLVVLRGQNSADQIFCVYLDTHALTFMAVPNAAIGRVFAAYDA